MTETRFHLSRLAPIVVFILLYTVTPCAHAHSLRAWIVSADGTGPWTKINGSDYPFSLLRAVDFDKNGKADIFVASGGKWFLSQDGVGAWQQINASNVPVGDLRFGDFDNDNHTDVFTTWGGKWRISSGGKGGWQVINTSSVGVSDLGFADFNGDGRTDVFATWGGKWRVSFGGTSNWQVINTSSLTVKDLRFGDFNGDGKADVFSTWGGKWHVSFGGTGPWKDLNTSSLVVADLVLADFVGDAKTDVFASWGGKWRVSSGGTGGWQVINTSSYGVSQLLFGNFLGSSKSDVFTTAAEKHVSLDIRRFPTTPLGDAAADSITAGATTALQINDGPGDEACFVHFSRDAGVALLASGDGSIDSSAEFNAAVSLPGNVMVVNQINWCSGFQAGIIGCSPTPGDSEVVTRFPGSMEGLLWAHEYGHTRGLQHRSDPNAIMFPFIGPTNKRVTASECNAFHQ